MLRFLTRRLPGQRLTPRSAWAYALQFVLVCAAVACAVVIADEVTSRHARERMRLRLAVPQLDTLTAEQLEDLRRIAATCRVNEVEAEKRAVAACLVRGAAELDRRDEPHLHWSDLVLKLGVVDRSRQAARPERESVEPAEPIGLFDGHGFERLLAP